MPEIIEEICDGCGLCIEACLNDAIYIKNKKAKVYPDLCLDCGLCIGSCPNNAIIQHSPSKKQPENRPIPMFKQPTYLYPLNSPILNRYHNKLKRQRRRQRQHKKSI